MQTFSRNLVHSFGASVNMAATFVAGGVVAAAADAVAASVTNESIGMCRWQLAFGAVAMAWLQSPLLSPLSAGKMDDSELDCKFVRILVPICFPLLPTCSQN